MPAAEARPPLLLLHGLMGSGRDWQALAEALQADFTVLCPDLPGHGQCPETRCDFAHQAQYLMRWLEDQGHTSAHLLGYSMGGRLALYLATHYPERVRSLLLESSSPGLADPQARADRQVWDATWADRFENEALSDVLQAWYAQPLFDSLRQWPGFDALLQRRANENRGPALARALREGGTGQMPPLWGALAELILPVGCLSGQADARYSALALEMQRCQPRLQLYSLPGGHNLHLENPTAWLRAVQQFYRLPVHHLTPQKRETHARKI
ncbi:MAG: 2-succinyl-6-hydroxy-2,4-cyclohexadiene-1-carboxylate synthase [Candidatus Sericytochromatia bacterium]|nr:2-succinyl-6-hydroxy-2,4-cyclohexadiene-1-carboxylate synthase [Candidatus Sericytochromatia bacterium]